MRKAVIVVPCYNEEARLSLDGFRAFLGKAGLSVLFVDDGSTDRTAQVLDRLCAGLEGRAGVLRLPRNAGKAEAVRRGMLAAIEAGADITGYFDADLATPAEEMLRLLTWLEKGAREVAMGSRVRLLGTAIESNPIRHYLGRVFATVASLCLHLPVYDTQCGAKIFRCTELLRGALSERFVSRWGFDVELLGRIRCGTRAIPGAKLEAFVEMPLQSWYDKSGSKVRPADYLRTGFEFIRIWRDLHKRRRLVRDKLV